MTITKQQLQRQLAKDRKDFMALSVNVREAIIAELTGVWNTHLWDEVVTENSNAREAAAKSVTRKVK
ncbi:MAG: hypothetical protein VX569_11800 [Pseudomonadota bacterium]|nr:hypothetical protein [Pseudomonadota bacterium]